jgi:hypothetical protein
LLRDELDELEKESSGKLSIWYTISKSENPSEIELLLLSLN